MLTTHRYVKCKNEIKWENTFELLKEFIKENNRFPRINEVYKGVNLGVWCATQRQSYKGNTTTLLDVNKIILLNSIGFVWDQNEKQWYDTFKILKEFVKKYGRFPKEKEIYKGFKLAKWCERQRQVYKGNSSGKLTQEKIQLLESIGFEWDPKNIDKQWENNFELLKKFIKEFNRFPKQDEMYGGINLGGWCSTQRQAYRGALSYEILPERIELLESIGFIWKIREDIWIDHFILLKEFKQKYNRFPIAMETYKNVNLGHWCNIQRQLHNNENNGRSIPIERVQLLNSIGFIWDQNGIRWQNNFELLKEFKREFNRFPASKESYKDVNLGHWCSLQRQAYKEKSGRKKLSEDKIDLLNSIEFEWYPYEKAWMENFKLLKEFIEEYGRFPKEYEKYNNFNLGTWCARQRQVFKGNHRGKLTQEKIDLLNSINFVW